MIFTTILLCSRTVVHCSIVLCCTIKHLNDSYDLTLITIIYDKKFVPFNINRFGKILYIIKIFGKKRFRLLMKDRYDRLTHGTDTVRGRRHGKHHCPWNVRYLLFLPTSALRVKNRDFVRSLDSPILGMGICRSMDSSLSELGRRVKGDSTPAVALGHGSGWRKSTLVTENNSSRPLYVGTPYELGVRMKVPFVCHRESFRNGKCDLLCGLVCGYGPGDVHHV